ncbi:MAG TPA: hypothetical protein EYN89_08755, partial [Flavobacteriales bacterium]|nr:hypothetical protein [Flavobacteriales bacterium]
TIGGVYSDTLTSVSTCDSVITTTLTIFPVFNTPQALEICQGDSIMLEGAYQTIGGVYSDTLTSVSTCDSVITTTLTISPVFNTPQALEICQGDSIMLEGAYQTTGGIYYDTLSATSTCDSVITTTLSVAPEIISPQDLEICQGDSIAIGNIYVHLPGNYYDTLQAVSGCDSIIVTNLTIAANLVLDISNDASIDIGESIDLEVSGATSYLWSTGDTNNLIIVSPLETTTYYVTGTSSIGCEATAEVLVEVVYPFNIYVPNIFSTTSLNQDNKNLYVFGNGVESMNFVIFDRWGEIVFKSENIKESNRADGLCCKYGYGWNGRYKNNGKELNTGVFSYKLSGRFTNGEKFFEKGNITLIRK